MTLEAYITKYSPDQERDEDGKWTDGTGDSDKPKTQKLSLIHI